MRQPPPLPKEPVPPDRASRLLPLIRLSSRRNGPFPWSTRRGLAVFREIVVLFDAAKGPVPSGSTDIHDRLEAMEGVRVIRKVRADELGEVSARPSGRDFLLSFPHPAGGFSFRLRESEAPHLFLVLSKLLGDRFRAGPPTIARTARVTPGVTGIVVAIATLLLGAGALVTALSVAGNRDPQTAAIAPTWFVWGIMLCLYSLLYLIWRLVGSMRRRPAAEPIRSPVWSLALRAVGLALFVLGWLFPWELVDLAAALGWVDSADPVSHGIALGLGNLGPVFLALPCLYFGYRLGLRSADSTLRDDSRPAALYLRSFGDDGRHTFVPDSIPAKLLGLRVFKFLARLGPLVHLYPVRAITLALGTARDTAEEQLASFFRKLGPFVAIGRPGEGLAEGGADRIYVGHDVWQEKVLSLLGRSACVILQPAETEGVWWEIETCLRIVPKGRLLLSLVNYRDSDQAYEEFRLKFEELGGPVLPRQRGDAIFLWLDPDGRAVPLAAIHHFPLGWPLQGNAVDFRSTLLPFLKHFEPERFHQVRSRRRPPVLQRAGMAAALLLWCGVWWAGPLAFGHWRSEVVSASLPDVAHVGRDLPYVWTLDPKWSEIPPLGGEDRRFRGRSGTEFASVAVVKGMSDNLTAIDESSREDFFFSLNRRTRIDRREFERDGHRWLRTVEKVKNRNDPLSFTVIRDACRHPEGALFVQVQAPSLLLDWQGGLRAKLERALDGFTPPPVDPAPPLSYRDAGGRFSIDLPPGWIERESGDANVAVQFQYWPDPIAIVSVYIFEPPLPATSDENAAMERILTNLNTVRFPSLIPAPEWTAVSRGRANRNGLEWIDSRVLHTPGSLGMTKSPSMIHHFAQHFAASRTLVLEARTPEPPSPRVEAAIAGFQEAFRPVSD